MRGVAGLAGRGRNPGLLAVLRPLEGLLGARADFETLLVAAYASTFSADEDRDAAAEVGRALDTVRDTEHPDKAGKAKRRRKVQDEIPDLLAGDAGDGGESGGGGSDTKGRRKVEAGMCEEGLAEALDFCGYKVRYDLREGALQFRGGKVGDTWTRLCTLLAPMIVMHVAQVACFPVKKYGEWTTLPFRVSITRLEEWCTALARDQGAMVDEFKQWMTRCKPVDGGPELAQWMHDVFGVERTPYNDWHARYPWIRATELALNPGSQRGVMPVWLMPSGAGKTTAIGAFPPPGNDWVSERLDMDLGAKVNRPGKPGG